MSATARATSSSLPPAAATWSRAVRHSTPAGSRQSSYRLDVPRETPVSAARAVCVIPAAVRVWEAAVDAWLTGDLDAMTDVLEGVIMELDSGYDAYTFVPSVGWAA